MVEKQASSEEQKTQSAQSVLGRFNTFINDMVNWVTNKPPPVAPEAKQQAKEGLNPELAERVSVKTQVATPTIGHGLKESGSEVRNRADGHTKLDEAKKKTS